MLHKEDTERDRFQQWPSVHPGHQSILAIRSLPTASAGPLVFTLPSCDAELRASSPPYRRQTEGLGRCYTTHILSKTKKLNLKQENIVPQKATSSALAVGTLYLFTRKCSRPKAHSYGPSGGQKTACTRRPFLTRPKWTSRWKYGCFSRDQHGT